MCESRIDFTVGSSTLSKKLMSLGEWEGSLKYWLVLLLIKRKLLRIRGEGLSEQWAVFGLAITVNVNCLPQTIQQKTITVCMLRYSLLIRLFSDDGCHVKNIFAVSYSLLIVMSFSYFQYNLHISTRLVRFRDT